MQRWHSEESLMRRRQKVEISKHRSWDRDDLSQPIDCHCMNGIGTMRKHRPYEACGDTCSICDLRRFGKRLTRRKQRRVLRRANDQTDIVQVNEWW